MLFVTTQQAKTHYKECGWKSATMVEHQHNRINIVEERSAKLCQIAWCVLSFWSLFLASHVFSTPYVSLFDIVLMAIFTHMLANKASCGMCREWIVSWCDWCDMHRLYNWYNALEACTKRWHLQIWYHSLSIHIISHHIISYHVIPYHIVTYCIILYHIVSCCIILYHIVSHNVIPWYL